MRGVIAGVQLSWIYFSGTLDAAIWGCELARDGPLPFRGEGWERGPGAAPARTAEPLSTSARRQVAKPSYLSPEGERAEACNPTQSYRSREPLRVVGEVESWEPHSPERLAEMKAALARMADEGGPEIID
jgi:DNA/RNA tunnel of bacterial DNA dependent RNA polymerase.